MEYDYVISDGPHVVLVALTDCYFQCLTYRFDRRVDAFNFRPILRPLLMVLFVTTEDINGIQFWHVMNIWYQVLPECARTYHKAGLLFAFFKLFNALFGSFALLNLIDNTAQLRNCVLAILIAGINVHIHPNNYIVFSDSLFGLFAHRVCNLICNWKYCVMNSQSHLLCLYVRSFLAIFCWNSTKNCTELQSKQQDKTYEREFFLTAPPLPIWLFFRTCVWFVVYLLTQVSVSRRLYFHSSFVFLSLSRQRTRKKTM